MNRAKASDLILKIRRKIDRHVTATFVAGSYRRGREEIGDLDFVVVGADLPTLVAAIEPEKIVRCGSLLATVIYEGEQIEFYCTTADCLGAALMHSTGSGEFNVSIRSIAKKKGYRLNQYGLWKDGQCIAARLEEDIFAALGMKYVPPEWRQTFGHKPTTPKQDESNEALAKALFLIASNYKVQKEEWRARAFARAASQVKDYKETVTKSNAHDVPGVGPGIEAEIAAILEYGTSKRIHL
jgi:DNA polymerase/3'-5' exonuclease PolX